MITRSVTNSQFGSLYQTVKEVCSTSVNVKYKEYEGTRTLYIMEGYGPELVGRGWLGRIPSMA